ncbi:DNA uptake protein [Spiroplasma litorale]|uniref:DNA uptake protein n=2 Tax=Spiroplasma litorale TaxID=216942 RepID=A0A0K1W1Z1_9MOLU|nr:DNA uptake protein [Spiroplasma litorale]
MSSYYIRVGKYKFSIGELVYIEGEMKKLSKHHVNWGFDFNSYLRKNNVRYEIYNINQVVRKYKTLSFYYWKMSENNNILLKLLIFQNKNDITLLKTLNDLGISHVINLGGLNFYILDRFIDKKILKKDNYKKFKPIFILLLLIYNYLLGLKLIIIKSTLSIFFRYLNKLQIINIKKWNLQSLQWIIIFSLNPSFIYSIGFFYSIAFNLLYLDQNNKILISKKRVIYNFLLVIFISFPLQIHFHYKIWLFSTIFEVVLFPLIFMSYIICILFPYLVNLSNFLYSILDGVSRFLNIFNKILIVGKVSLLFLIIYFIFLKILNVYIFMNKKFKIIFRTIFFSFFLSLIQYNQLNIFENSIVMLDVGNGNSFLLKNKNNYVILDAGAGYGYSESIFKNYLDYKGVRNVKAAIISHYHSDHYNQLNEIKKNIKINDIYFNDNIVDKIIIKDIIISNFVYLNNKDENDNSIISFIELNNKKLLFVGDATKKTENKLIENNEFINKIDNGGVDFLQIGHHGSKTSTSDEFIKLLRPNNCYISGKHEKYKDFPSKETIETLNKYNCSISVTNNENNYKYNINKNSSKTIKKTLF